MSVLRIEARGFCVMRLRCGGAASDRHAWSPEVLDLEAMRCGFPPPSQSPHCPPLDLRHAECSF